MPRVTIHKKSKGGKREYRCSCGKPIEPGQRYYFWSKRYGGDYYRHVDCGYPRPSQLSGAKTAVIDDAVIDATNAIENWSPELDEAGEYHDGWQELEDARQEVASIAREVGEEYESGVDNMPEALQDGATGEAMRDVAQRLSDWADELDDFSGDEPDLGDEWQGEEIEPEEDWRDARAQALGDWANEMRANATAEFGDVPYYEG